MLHERFKGPFPSKSNKTTHKRTNTCKACTHTHRAKDYSRGWIVYYQDVHGPLLPVCGSCSEISSVAATAVVSTSSTRLYPCLDDWVIVGWVSDFSNCTTGVGRYREQTKPGTEAIFFLPRPVGLEPRNPTLVSVIMTGCHPFILICHEYFSD